jgi:hypothetical protein
LKERFGWAEVTEEAIDNVIDNSDAIELGLDDRCKQAVRHALGQEKAVVFAYVFKPCPSLGRSPARMHAHALPSSDFQIDAGISCARSISCLSLPKRNARGCKR